MNIYVYNAQKSDFEIERKKNYQWLWLEMRKTIKSSDFKYENIERFKYFYVFYIKKIEVFPDDFETRCIHAHNCSP